MPSAIPNQALLTSDSVVSTSKELITYKNNGFLNSQPLVDEEISFANPGIDTIPQPIALPITIALPSKL